MLFVRQDGSYLTVTAAVEGDYTSLVNRDIPVLGEAGYTIALQLEVNRSYCLQQQTDAHLPHSGLGIRPKCSRRVYQCGAIGGRLSPTFQVCTYDGCNPPKRISLARLATEVGKAIQQFIEVRHRALLCWIAHRISACVPQRMQGQNIAPAYSGWRVGPGWTQIENLHLAALEQVSAGSWQPRLFYKPLV